MLVLVAGLLLVQLAWADPEPAHVDVELTTAQHYAASFERFRATKRDAHLKAVQRYAIAWEHFLTTEKEAQMEATGRNTEAREQVSTLLETELAAQRYAASFARSRAAERDSHLNAGQ